MLIQGSVNSLKTDILVERYINLINNGADISEVLVLTLNSYKKAQFIQNIQKKYSDIDLAKLKVYTLYGLCYNAFLDNWEYISNLIKTDKRSKKPNLCGLEVSQYIFKQCIKEGNFSDYISKVNLLHQLFRRYSLIVYNNFSEKEVKERSLILKESFYSDAQKAIEDYKLKTFEYMSFDYLRQLSVLPLIYKNTDYFKNIKYIFVDDADEMPYIFWQFLDSLMPNLDDYYISFDKNGSSRQGFLCAYKSGISDFIAKYNPKIQVLQDKSVFADLSLNLFEKIKTNKKLENSSLKCISSIKRLDMFDEVHKYLNSLILSGVSPSQIAVITPVFDDILIQNFLENKFNIKFQFLSGSKKLSDDIDIKYIITVLKLVNNLTLNEYELKNLLINLFQIPFKKCFPILINFEKNKKLCDFDFDNEAYDYSYKKLLSIVISLSKQNITVSEQIKIICSNLEIKINDFLIKEAQSFEIAFNNLTNNIVKDFIIQIENSIISENSSEVFKIKPDEVILSTPQKIIDYSIKTKYQLWLDVSHNEWMKDDSGTLYNAWVFNRDYNKNTFTLEDNVRLEREKTASIVRKLMLCAQENVCLYSSVYDNNGNENFSALTDFIEFKEDKDVQFKIVPREDQKNVLEYRHGKMGITAVPGAGKTTILLALVSKLIQDGVKSENIFVLTYMESAAKNFKERIKSVLKEDVNLPNISTIHGLALRIIKENSNFTKVGLDENFQIIDDAQKEKFIKEIFYKLKIDDDNYDNYLRCLSAVKLSCNYNINSPHKDIKEFLNFYNEYNILLKKNNLIDYDDMLYFAVKILEENKEILKYYQNICRYIIEDEAQDSTKIQQKLLDLLSAEHKNLVRCGDINQAITSSFTNSDTDGFKLFLNKNKKVEMNSSQRSSKPIYTLANSLVKNKDFSSAFYDIEIKGTPNNPKNIEKPQFLQFENEKEERYFLLNKIKEIFSDNSESSVAILLRLNSQVNDLNEFFISNGIKTSVRTDCLCQKNIFKIIFALLNIIQSPLNNKYIIELAKNYGLSGICDISEKEIEYIKNLNEPFINLNPDEINNQGLCQLYWDIDYILNQSACEIKNLVLKIGLYYSKNDIDKANTYIISELINRLEKTYKLSEIINQLEYLSIKPLSSYKLFEDELNQDYSAIQIMTVHKSKGDEFDYVFIPQMNEDNFPTKIENVKLKTGVHFYQTIKNLCENSGVKSPEMLKKEQLDESLRLIYVAITRAKKQLFITNAKLYLKNKKVKISNLFGNF